MAPGRRSRKTIHVPVEVPLIGQTPLLAPNSSAGTAPGRIYALPPTSVSSTPTDFDVDLLGGGQLISPPSLVKVGNLTPYVMVVTLNAQQDHLRAWESNVFPSNGASTMHCHPIAITTPTPAGSFFLFTSVGEAGSQFPGTWPIMNQHITQSFTPEQVLTTITTPGDGLPHTQTISLPAGTIGVAYVVDSGTPASVTIAGHQTGTFWIFNSGGLTSPPQLQQAAPIGATDTSVDCTVTDSGAATSVTFFAYTTPPFTYVLPSWNNGPVPLYVNNTTAALWQAPTNVTTYDNAALVAGGTDTIVAAPSLASQSIYVHSILLQVDSAAGGPGNDVMQVRSSSAGTSGTHVYITANSGAYNTNNYGQWFQNFGGGVPCVAGDSLQIRNPDTANHKVKCSVAYSVG